MQTWLNLQNAYDVKVAVATRTKSQKGGEKEICEMIDFKYFGERDFMLQKSAIL